MLEIPPTVVCCFPLCRCQVGPELEIPGYGCEDHFNEHDTVEHSWVRARAILGSFRTLKAERSCHSARLPAACVGCWSLHALLACWAPHCPCVH